MLRPLAIALLVLGCGQDIGDDCNSNAECGTGRFCDRASKDGYCTVSPCTVAPNSCPENSICVEFEDAQTFCMYVCESKDDCRDGYDCVEHADPSLPEDDPERLVSDHRYCRSR